MLSYEASAASGPGPVAGAPRGVQERARSVEASRHPLATTQQQGQFQTGL